MAKAGPNIDQRLAKLLPAIADSGPRRLFLPSSAGDFKYDVVLRLLKAEDFSKVSWPPLCHDGARRSLDIILERTKATVNEAKKG